MSKIMRFLCNFFYPEILSRVNFLTNLKSGAVWRQSKCAILLIYRDMSKAAPINASQCNSDRGQSVEQELSVTTLQSGW